jgi:hypothetical protein
LYQSKPRGWVKDKVEKTTDDYTFEKEEKEYTFAPDLGNSAKSIATT